MFKFTHFFLIVSLFFICACQSQNKEAEKEESELVDTTETVIEKRNATSFLYDLKALEAVFTNDNWLLANSSKDSSYFYFSRLGDFAVNTYEYVLRKGDSADVQKSTILIQDDKITWRFNNQDLYLDNASSARAVWKVAANDSLKYVFQRANNNEINLTYPDKTKRVLKKILPFSLFLVRSRYDYTNGTHYAFDSSQFNKKK